MIFKKATFENCVELTKLRFEMRRERNESIENGEEFYNNTLNFFVNNITSDKFVAYICLVDNKIIAMSGICFYSVPPIASVPNGKVAYLMNMYTLPQFRNMGVATKLLQYTMNEARERQCFRVSLSASEAGEQLYVKYGFKYSSSSMDFYFKDAE